MVGTSQGEYHVFAELLNWLQGLPQPALVVAAGLLVLGECTIGLGFLVPGEGGLLVASTTATTVPRFLVLWLVVSVCAGVGDTIGFLVGRRYGVRLRDTRLIQRYGVAGWDRATLLLARWGAWAVFVARFFPVVRTLTPAAAGTSGLALRRFIPAAALGAVCWSGLHIALGVALGQAARQVERYLSTGGAVVVILAVVIGGMFWLRARRRRRARRIVDGAGAGG